MKRQLNFQNSDDEDNIEILREDVMEKLPPGYPGYYSAPGVPVDIKLEEYKYQEESEDLCTDYPRNYIAPEQPQEELTEEYSIDSKEESPELTDIINYDFRMFIKLNLCKKKTPYINPKVAAPAYYSNLSPIWGGLEPRQLHRIGWVLTYLYRIIAFFIRNTKYIKQHFPLLNMTKIGLKPVTDQNNIAIVKSKWIAQFADKQLYDELRQLLGVRTLYGKDEKGNNFIIWPKLINLPANISLPKLDPAELRNKQNNTDESYNAARCLPLVISQVMFTGKETLTEVGDFLLIFTISRINKGLFSNLRKYTKRFTIQIYNSYKYVVHYLEGQQKEKQATIKINRAWMDTAYDPTRSLGTLWKKYMGCYWASIPFNGKKIIEATSRAFNKKKRNIVYCDTNERYLISAPRGITVVINGWSTNPVWDPRPTRCCGYINRKFITADNLDLLLAKCATIKWIRENYADDVSTDSFSQRSEDLGHEKYDSESVEQSIIVVKD